jgi:predicted ABC-type transport system involved in lysophospholipase L1 biosynthesis ATPase subunit
MAELNEEHGTTLVLVTHDAELAGRARRVLRLRDGAMVEDADQPQASVSGARGGR